jgi:uncharacterized protein YjbJ (UPF0337 family)
MGPSRIFISDDRYSLLFGECSALRQDIQEMGSATFETKLMNRSSVQQRKRIMSSTTDKISGAANEVSGKAKQTAGKVIDNHELQAKGKAQELKGKAETAAGKAKDGVKKAVDSI